jgi:hypothetical protein
MQILEFSLNESIILFPTILSKRILVFYRNSFASAYLIGYILLAIYKKKNTTFLDVTLEQIHHLYCYSTSRKGEPHYDVFGPGLSLVMKYTTFMTLCI